MSKRIIVAGAGHGGVVAAAKLSEKGFDVTVYEAREKENIGHDWHDCLWKPIFEETGIPEPENIAPNIMTSYFNPSKTVLINPDKNKDKPSLGYVDRKEFINYLISVAEKNGAKFVFGTKVTGVICSEDRVTGIKTEKDGITEDVYADFIIDAAGIDSPVRRNLPESFGIEREIRDEDTFYVYRAYYEKKDGFSSLPKYCIYFCHCKNIGLDWVINDDEFVDVLIGSFGSFKDGVIDNALNDFKSDYEVLGDKIIRGGQITKIPLRHVLSRFAYNGYAAVGDSAFMTEPLSGSGISLSMSAGAMLSDVITDCDGDPFTKENLWKYESAFLKKYIPSYLSDEYIKNAMVEMGPDNLDAMFTKKVMGKSELCGGSKLNAQNILQKAKGVITTPGVFPALIHAVEKIAKIKTITNTIPDEFDEEKIKAWEKKYNQ